MLFRTPGRTSLVGLVLMVLLALQLRPALQADAAAFRTALAAPPSAPPPAALKSVAARPIEADTANPFESATPEPAFARLGAAVLSLVYRVEPDEEPLLPGAPPPGAVEEAAHRPASSPPSTAAPITSASSTRAHPRAVPFLPIRWEGDAVARTAPAAGRPGVPPPLPTATRIALPAQPHPQDLARAAYAALDAGSVSNAALLFDMALAAAPSGQLAADLAYTRLRLGQRREAAKAFESALRLGATTPEAGALWQREASRLHDRFSLQAYTFLRDDRGRASPAAFGTAAPGQSQSALLLQVRPDPLARRPVLLVGRLLAAHQNNSDSALRRSTQATAGVGWLAIPAVGGTVVAERWLRLGDESRNAWALRAHGGYGEGYGPPAGGTTGWLHWSVFGETAVIGTRRRDLYAGGEARAGYGHALGPQARAIFTGALWAQVQHDDLIRHRVEAGPSLTLEATLGQLPIHLRLDYRFALTAPHAASSGATVTFAAGF